MPTRSRGTGARGLSVINDMPSDLFVMFSTAPGNKAEDGAAGSRNSPFAEAFLKHINSTEPLSIMAAHVTSETLNLTDQRQRPFYRGSIISDIYYSLNPTRAPGQTAQVTPAPVATHAPRPEPQPAPKPPRERQPRVPKEITPAHLHTIGVSIGSSFADPALILTVYGTYSPIRHLFIQLGLDVGFLSVYDEVQSYYSIYPFTHVGSFLPIKNIGGLYAGLGVGYMTGQYIFSRGNTPADINIFATDFFTGFNFLNIIDISYTLRTDFKSASNKLTVGYTYRFK